MTNILIVDDHPLVRRGMAELIRQERDLAVCGEASGARHALRLLDSSRPDLAIVDISLSDGDGIDLVRRLKTLHPALKIIVCSMREERLYVGRALRAGAMGYVSKNEPGQRIITAIRKVIGGELYLSPEMSRDMLEEMVAGGGNPASDSAGLSDRQLTVLRLLGEGLTSRQIAERLGLSVKTVDTHRENIKRKLNLANASELIRYAVTWNLGAR